MCGIAGFVVHHGNPNLLQQRLMMMSDSIKHRGPDDCGYYLDGFDVGSFVGLAHRRLSIIDLSSGHQPMSNDDVTTHIVFNGEIYNFATLRRELIAAGYCFKTSSDTEVILRAYEEYGASCVEKLRGMFAFAIWDAKKQSLFIARDRFGQKPLYYTQYGKELVFGSEIKSILAQKNHEHPFNEQAMVDYLQYRYVPSPATLFSGIYKLPPGCYGIWGQGEWRMERYYTPPDQSPRAATARHYTAQDFLAKLDESVQLRMISDVPFGAFLSGGLDSSAIVALMARHSSQPINTFSVGFRESKYSELAYARTIAEQFNTNHHELEVDDRTMMETLPDLIGFRDAPVSEPSDIPVFLLASEARKTVKMVLTGEGSDEILGGYPKHSYERFVTPFQYIPSSLRGAMEASVNALPYRFRRAKTALANLQDVQWASRMPRWFGALNHQAIQSLLMPSFHHLLESSNGDTAYHLQSHIGNSGLRRILYFDQTSWLPDNLLERGDRMTMAASIEARMPFMDHCLIAMASELADRDRIRGMTGKWILRRAAQSIIPKHIIDRPKVGFRVPVNEWFQHGMKDYLCDHLLATKGLSSHYFQRDVVEGVIQEHTSGRHNHEKLLWSLLNLELWYRQYIHTEGTG
jgi:asparagine synthase (glutamine-hydrolysing)